MRFTDAMHECKSGLAYRQLEWPPLASVAVPMKKFSRPLGLPFSYPGSMPCDTAAAKMYLRYISN